MLKSIVSVVLLGVILPATVFAHKIKIFAAAEGDAIKGYAYYAGGSRMQQAEIIVLGPEGEKLGQVKTDVDGSFVYKIDMLLEHSFVVQTPDGHRAEFTVPANATSKKKKLGNGSVAAAKISRASDNLHQLNNKDLEEVIAKTVARELNFLREQLVLHDEKVRLRDIIGGIGYILGLAGLACFFQSRKKRQKEEGAA